MNPHRKLIGADGQFFARPLRDITDPRFRTGPRDEAEAAMVFFVVEHGPRGAPTGCAILCREGAPPSIRTHDDAAAWARSLDRNTWNAEVSAFYIQWWR